MADITTTTTDPAAVTAAPAAPVAAPAAPAPAPVATAPAASPPEAAKPPYLNPWATRGKAPAAKPAEVRPSSVSASPTTPAADPRVDALMAVLGETVAQDLSGVPANVAATIRAIAGEDPVAQRKALNAMRANGLASVTPAAAPSSIAAPASTTMPTAPVSVAATPANTDAARLAEYEKLSKVAPILASQYRQTHGAAIDRATKSRPTN